MRIDEEATRRRLGRAIERNRGSRSQEWLARELDVHQTTVSDWERGRTAPRASRFPQIERVLGMQDGMLRTIAFGQDSVGGADSPNSVVVSTLLGKIGQLSARDRRIVEQLVDNLLDQSDR